MKIGGMEFSIGADPEVFASLDGKFKSAHDLIQGTKEEPFKVERGAVQVDGMALEFNIDPAFSEQEFISNLETVQTQLKEMIGDCDFLKVPSVKFDKQFFESVPAYNRILGCTPDFNAYTKKVIRKPPAGMLMRTAGGHIHIGGFHTENVRNQFHMETCARLCRILDEKVGVFSLLWDKDDDRRKLYGKAGAFRPKPYGVEYRSLSNMWIWDKNIIKFVYDGVVEALECMFDINYEPNPIVRNIIDNSDRGNSYFHSVKIPKFLEKLA